MNKFCSILTNISVIIVTVQRFFRLILLWLPPILWMGVIFFLSNQPGLKITEGPLDFLMRKMAHVGEYAILFLLLYRALRGSFRLAAVTIIFFLRMRIR